MNIIMKRVTKKYSDRVKRNDGCGKLFRGVFWITKHAHMKETQLLKWTKNICCTQLNI